MKRSAVMFILPLLAAVSPLPAAEMFEAYPKKWALGYVADEVNVRYWFNPAWGLEAGVGLAANKARARSDDGVVASDDRANTHGHSLTVAGLRGVKNWEYLDVNLRAGFTYDTETATTDPEGPNNSERIEAKRYAFSFGPEAEIKVPFFSRLVIVSSIQAVYEINKQRAYVESIAGPTTTRQEARTFAFQDEGGTLDEFFHLGVRYYF